MFDRIAPVYDVMNRVMTAGLDQRWRRETVEAVVRPGDRVLDACCGTGDLAVAALEAGAGEVVGLDFSPRMLERARAKQQTLRGSRATCWPCRSRTASFDAATVGFGVRNVADLTAALAELRRVLRPGGRLGDSRDHDADRRCWRRSTASGSTGSCRCSGRCSRAAPRTRTCPRAFAASPGRTSWPGSCARPGSAESPTGPSPAGSSRCTRESARDGARHDPRGPGLESYLDELEERLAGDGRESSRRRRRGRGGGARRRRQAPAAAARLPLRPSGR